MEQSVFGKLLGSNLERVDGVLKDFSISPSAAAGTLNVVHHTGKMARFFIWILGLPKEGENQHTTVKVEYKKGQEYWNRRIGISKFRTKHAAVDGYLEETAGRFKFLHEVTVVDGGINYHQVRVYFLGIRLPRVMSPIIDATAKGDDAGWMLDLTVSCPRCGPICQYKGWITVE